MYTPDRRIVQRIQIYDPLLFVEWNNHGQYFELWRKKAVGKVLVTPITQSIYNNTKPKVFVELDERILFWIWSADSWRRGGARFAAQQDNEAWMRHQGQASKYFNSNCRAIASEVYRGINNFYATKQAKKNPKPTFKGHTKGFNWIAPDIKSNLNGRLFSRSKVNALKYDYTP